MTHTIKCALSHSLSLLIGSFLSIESVHAMREKTQDKVVPLKTGLDSSFYEGTSITKDPENKGHRLIIIEGKVKKSPFKKEDTSKELMHVVASPAYNVYALWYSEKSSAETPGIRGLYTMKMSLFDTISDEHIVTFECYHMPYMSKDGRYIAAQLRPYYTNSSRDNVLSVIDLKEKRYQERIVKDYLYFSWVPRSSKVLFVYGSLLFRDTTIITSEDYYSSLIDVESGEEIHVSHPHIIAECADWSGDGRYCVIGGRHDSIIRRGELWNYSIDNLTTPVWKVSFPDESIEHIEYHPIRSSLLVQTHPYPSGKLPRGTNIKLYLTRLIDGVSGKVNHRFDELYAKSRWTASGELKLENEKLYRERDPDKCNI